jgi:hypothetical protein
VPANNKPRLDACGNILKYLVRNIDYTDILFPWCFLSFTTPWHQSQEPSSRFCALQLQLPALCDHRFAPPRSMSQYCKERKPQTNQWIAEYDASQRPLPVVKLSISRMFRQHPSPTSLRPRCS